MLTLFFFSQFLGAVSGGALQYKTFTAKAIPLRSGQVIQTRQNWGPLPWPEGPIALRHFESDIVDENGNTVPLEEIYVHHWLMYNDKNDLNGGLCGGFLANIFGAGAEIRGVQQSMAYPYALVTDGTEHWTANLHFIRTTNVPQNDLQSCVECECGGSTPKHPSGGVECCPDGTMCWGMRNSTLQDTKNYYFQYTLGWEEVTPEIKPVKIYSMDVTAHLNEDCLIEYNIPALKDGERNIRRNIVFIESDWNITFAEIHLHVGGSNMTLEHYRNGKSLGIICTAHPVYSGPMGYIEDIPTCHFPEIYQVLKGDQIHMTAEYSNRGLPGGHPYHTGVMSLAFIAAHAGPLPKEICLTRLHELCGAPPYDTLKQCASCAGQHLAELRKTYECTALVVANECEKNIAGGNVPVPDTVTGMTLVAIRFNTTHYEFNVTGPADRWFAIASKELVGTMEGANAWSYEQNDKGEWKLVERILGMHQAGHLVNDDFGMVSHKVVDNVVSITFDAAIMGLDEDKLFLPGDCFLFAQGAAGVKKFGYHGSARGATCMMH